MKLNLAGVSAVFCLLLAYVSSFNIRPLRAGTIIIKDSDIRASQNFNRIIDLKMSKIFYQNSKGLNCLASITSLSMDDQLSFYFDYNIVCPSESCFLNFTFIRKTEIVNTAFKYSLTIDYLVAFGLRILNLNMTSYQEHLMFSDIVSYDENGQRQQLGKTLPYNNQDAMRALMIPNGFSNLTRTGRVVYNYVMSTDMYVFHYMDHERHSEGDYQGWAQGADFIKYKILFIDAFYEPAHECKTDDQWNLKDHYEMLCDGGKNLKWFFGFKRTKEQQIKGQFFQLRSGYFFSIAKSPSEYAVTAFPMLASSEFIDHREHQYKFTREYLMIGEVAGMLLITGLLAGSIFLSYKYISRTLRRNRFKNVSPKYGVFNGEEEGPKSETGVISPHEKV